MGFLIALLTLVLVLDCIVLVFLVLRRMTGAVWRSGFVAALFALHPLHVESVAWVAERKDVLSTLCFLLTLGAYVRYAAIPKMENFPHIDLVGVGVRHNLNQYFPDLPVDVAAGAFYQKLTVGVDVGKPDFKVYAQNVIDNARAKLASKKVPLVVANRAQDALGADAVGMAGDASRG